jgi:hypothetical protein
MHLGEAKAHVTHAIGGDPSVAPGQTVDERKLTVINHAGMQLYSRPWKFREASLLMDLVADQDTLTQPTGMAFATGGEFVSAVRTVDGEPIEVVTAEELDHLRDAVTRTPVAGWTTHMAVVWGGGVQKIHVFPTPTQASTAAVRFRYRKEWWQVGSADTDAYTFPFPGYTEPLFTAYLRAYAQGYEDDGMPARIAEVDAGPLLQSALMKDGLAARDVGRLRPQRGRGFRS